MKKGRKPYICWTFRPSMDCFGIVRGGDRRDRTADLLIANQTLSQLSYAPLNHFVTSAMYQMQIDQLRVGRNFIK